MKMPSRSIVLLNSGFKLLALAALMAAGSDLYAVVCREPVVAEITNASLQPPPTGPLTIVSLNMAGVTDYKRILKEIRGNSTLLAAGVLLLQEVLHENSTDGLLQNLSRELGVHAVFSSSTEPRTNGKVDGLALLSRYPITDATAFGLPMFNLNVRSRCRHALAATIAVPGIEPMRAFNVHLDTRINARKRGIQMGPIVAAAKGFSGPTVIGGDLNTNPMFWIGHMLFVPWAQDQHGPLDDMLSEHGFSTPMDGSKATHDQLGLRIDWIYLRGLTSTRWGVEPLDFSDHHAIWIRLDAE